MQEGIASVDAVMHGECTELLRCNYQRINNLRCGLGGSYPQDRIDGGDVVEVFRADILGADDSDRPIDIGRDQAEYDLAGWTVPDLVNPDDVSALR